MLPSLLAFLAIAVSAGCAIAAAWRGDRPGLALFKPLTTILVGVAVLWGFVPAMPRYQDWILLGLALSLAGDLLLLPGVDRFLPALAAFLAAQLVYARAFTLGVGVDPVQLPWLAPFAFLSLVMLVALWAGLRRAALRAGVIVYAAAIAVMAWRAAVRVQSPVVPHASAVASLAGACLFFASDAVLAVDRFRRPFRAGRPVTLALYWAAQALIGFSVRIS